MRNTTPVPNVIFDHFLKELNCVELKIVLVIIRQTLGWCDNKTKLGRKQLDWISGSQLRQKTGSSRRAISSATEHLVTRKLIEVLDERGNLLDIASERKGKTRLYYRLSRYVEKNGENPVDNHCTNAFIALDIRKKVTALTQKMRITKETLQN